MTKHFPHVLEAHGFPHLRFHDLRHSAVYTLRKGGCDMRDIQAWLGHSDITTTANVYGHVFQKDMEKLGEVVDATIFQAPKAG